MTKNERYIAFTRALDSLYIYSDLLDIRGFEHKDNKNNIELNKLNITNKKVIDKNLNAGENYIEDEKIRKDHTKSEVRAFFEEKGLKVVDKRDQGGRLWVVGEKDIIRNYINEAIAKFGISGKYMVGKEIGNKEGWFTKTDK
jgi:hypothetical protein